MATTKNIIICSDGTGNTAIKGRGTNVFKMFEAVDIYGHWNDPRIPLQVAIYDDGIGSGGVKFWRIFCGAVGWGLGRNIRQLYTELVRIYEPGDSIYLFGFSRGAFTVRSLAGFIGTCGIIDLNKVKTDDLEAVVEEAYDAFRGTFTMSAKKSKLAWERADDFRRTHSVVHQEFAPDGMAKIRFIGVWDSVDAVGLPIDELTQILNWCFRFKFPDHVLSDHVQRACHALSIDDERRTFHPLMWDESGETIKDGKDARIEQVWFPGVHSNVGGGYPKQGMSMISLLWMMKKAEQAGLHIVDCDVHQVVDHQNPYDKLYDSRAGFAAYYRYNPRDIGQICKANGNITPRIHLSALERIVQGTDGYAPGNIPVNCQFVATEDNPGHLGPIGKEISAALAEKGPLLKKAQWWIDLRLYAQMMFLGVSIIFLLLILWDGCTHCECKGALSNLSSLEGLKKLGNCLLLNRERNLALLILIAFSYLAGRNARQAMESIYSKFWRDLLPALRDKLYPGAKSEI